MTSWLTRAACAAIIASALLMTSGCTAATTNAAPESPAPESPASASTPAASATPSNPQASAPPQAGAADAFRSWVEESRIPDVATACAGLAPDLVTRMIAELNASGAVTVETCEQMIAAAAELYRAVGDDGSVDIAVQNETATDATLFVTYLGSGDCGTVVMKRTGTDWIITNESRECVG